MEITIVEVEAQENEEECYGKRVIIRVSWQTLGQVNIPYLSTRKENKFKRNKINEKMQEDRPSWKASKRDTVENDG